MDPEKKLFEAWLKENNLMLVAFQSLTSELAYLTMEEFLWATWLKSKHQTLKGMADAYAKSLAMWGSVHNSGVSRLPN